MYHLLKVLTIVVVITRNSFELAREYEECLDVTELDTFVASKLSCAKYIFCDGENSFEGECLGGNYFNELEGICDDPTNVKCDIVESESVLSIYDENYNKSHVAKSDGEDGKTITPDVVNIEIDLSSTSSATEENIKDSNNVKLSESPRCPDVYGMTNIRHIAHSDSCSSFYTCYNGVAIPMLCPKNLYFNAETQKCDQQMSRNCKLRYSVRLNCRKGVYDYMPHPQHCEYYHYCINGFLMIMRCPYDFTWHYERRTCVHKSQSKCYVESSILTQQPVIMYRIYSS